VKIGKSIDYFYYGSKPEMHMLQVWYTMIIGPTHSYHPCRARTAHRYALLQNRCREYYLDEHQ